MISSGYMPLPAALGGAVEALDENLLRLNEKEGQVHFHVFSIHNDEAQIQSASYRNSTFHYVRPPRALLWVDRGIHAFAKNVLRK